MTICLSFLHLAGIPRASQVFSQACRIQRFDPDFERACSAGLQGILPSMTQMSLILALLLGPLPPLELTATAKDASEARSCCCCPVGQCQCGCDAPVSSVPDSKAPDSDDQSQNRSKWPRFCACDDLPLNLPSASVELPERVDAGDVLLIVAVEVHPSQALEFSGHLPHGPPPTLQSLATVVLLI